MDIGFRLPCHSKAFQKSGTAAAEGSRNDGEGAGNGGLVLWSPYPKSGVTKGCPDPVVPTDPLIVDKVENPKGDRVKVTFCSKFLPYEKW